MDGINFPFGKADVVDLGDAATYSVDINNTLTIVKRTGGLGQAVTSLQLVANKDLMDGSTVIIDIAQGGTGRNVTLGTNCTGPALTGVANDRDVITLTYDAAAAKFVARSVWQKIVDAA